ncbi:hypothetical protein ACFP1Z_09880 [Streptomyces gamaensis]|uniref:PqqD family protein n=1 Tax=Streptomyces gamaensis TaxID=1763542 RepID=A0ABW0Z099_9ACTN
MSQPHARRDGLRSRALDGGRLAVYDERTDTGHLLSPLCATVFRCADGTRTLDDLAEAASAGSGVPVSVDLVRLALAELEDKRLLDPPAGSSGSGLTRRRALARVAAVGAAAALLPWIDSVPGVTRRAAQAAEPARPGQRSAAGSPQRPLDITLTEPVCVSGLICTTIEVTVPVPTETPPPDTTSPAGAPRTGR